jgi:uncharacterized protein (TIGR03067 family)
MARLNALLPLPQSAASGLPYTVPGLRVVLAQPSSMVCTNMGWVKKNPRWHHSTKERKVMKKTLLGFLVSLFGVGLLPADGKQPADNATKEEIKRLKGTWEVVAIERAGENVTGKDLELDQIIFKGDKMTAKLKGKTVITLGFSVDPSKKPKAMDWINHLQKGSSPLRGIYNLKDGPKDSVELRLCFPLLPRKGTKAAKRPERPKSFKTKGKPLMLIVAQREKGE